MSFSKCPRLLHLLGCLFLLFIVFLLPPLQSGCELSLFPAVPGLPGESLLPCCLQSAVGWETG